MLVSKVNASELAKTLRQHPLYFGIAMVALLWLAVVFLIETERSANRLAIEQDTVNLARVFEENVIRSVSEIDKTLRFLRQAHRQRQTGTSWSELLRQAYAASEITLQLGVIGADGRLAGSTRGPQPPVPIDLSDRDHFKVHRDSAVDRLYISRPVLGRVSRQWSVQLARRISNPDGSFAGVIVASLDPSHFSAFYRSIDLGAGGSVSLVGDDGVVRASGGEVPYSLGSELPSGKLRSATQRSAEGTTFFVDDASGASRVASFRRVREFPLTVVVSTDEHQPGSAWLRHRPIYLGSAGILTLAILLATWLSARRAMRLADVRQRFVMKSRQLEATLENISQGVLMVDEQARIGFCSRRCAELLDLPVGYDATGRTFAEVVDALERSGEFGPIDGQPLHAVVRSSLAEQANANYERVRPDGTVLEVRSTPLPDGGFVRTISDITRRRNAEAQILKLARHDGLTELANRAVFRQRLDEAFSAVDAGASFAVHILDLDRFKHVNDTYGHHVGDKLLMEVAERLRRSIRAGDIAARIGGDEFALIQIDVADPAQAVAVAQRVCRDLSQPYRIDGQPLSVGCSAGIALAPAHARSAAEIVQAADLALYAAKQSRNGAWALYDPEMRVEHLARRSLEADLRNALAAEQFELHYQPIKSLKSGEVSAYEALIRWRHPQRGLVPPLDFIPLAEESGFIVQIGKWVLDTACRDIANRQGAARVAINLSPVQFRDPDLVDLVAQALERSGLPASRLEIEITETALLQDDLLTQRHLRQLRELGVHITMDDFGTGYSSMAYLLSYPIQSIKVDRSFVNGLGQQDNCGAIVRTIMTLAASLGLSTTAEGVETVEQLELLREMGCTEAQGFYFSKPLPADEILPPRWPPAEAAQTEIPRLRLATG